MKLVIVKWVDSRGATPSWGFLSESSEGVCEIVSAGWLVREEDDYWVIAPHMAVEDDEDHQACGLMNIPKSCIKESKVLQDGFGL